MRGLLAEAFIAHTNDLWPAGRDQGSPEWIAPHADEVLATVGRLYAIASSGEHPGGDEFLERLAWLPKLIAEIDRVGVQ